jgi:serine/threonine protein phosphatase PrpC
LETQAWCRTSVGRVRKENEDAFIADPDQGIFVVCDGMGGHQAGEVASSTAVEAVAGELRQIMHIIRELDAKNSPQDRQHICELMDASVQHACKRVFEIASGNPDYRGMGTTMSVLVVAGGMGYIAHVGDSRIFMVRGGRVYQLTEDHTVVAEQLKRGLITADEAKDAPYRSVLTRAVGIQEYVQVDTLPFEILPADYFVVCSDGLSNYIKGEELLAFLSNHPANDVPSKLVDAANERGGRDNITVLLVDVVGEDLSEQAKVHRQKVDALKAVPLFQHLSYEEILKVLRATFLRRCYPGDVIIEEGTTGDEMYVIQEGKVRVQKAGVELAQLGKHEHLGEMSFVDSAPRSASIVAIDQTDLITIRKDDFYYLLATDAPLGMKLLWAFIQVLSFRLRAANSELTQVKALVDKP